ncbi:MAG: sensor histidine kinase [Mucilaginibacter sp.]
MMNSIVSQNSELYVLIFSTVIFFTCLSGCIIYFIILYKNKQLKHKQEHELLQSTFRQELLKTQLEVQEQTLNNISREIHDNITQVLSFVKLNLAMAGSVNEEEKQFKIDESRELVAQTINDLRNLSKSMSFEHIAEAGLVRTLEIELSRINNSRLLKTSLVVEGDAYSLGEQRELVLFRIFQEALNNTLKYAAAKQLKISLQYSIDLFILTVEDDGDGFLMSGVAEKNGAGLKNIRNRAALIGAVATIDSSPNEGCSIKVTLNPLTQYIYADANYPNSPG